MQGQKQVAAVSRTEMCIQVSNESDKNSGKICLLSMGPNAWKGNNKTALQSLRERKESAIIGLQRSLELRQI